MDDKISQILQSNNVPVSAQPAQEADPIQNILQSNGIVAKPPDDVAAAEQKMGSSDFNGLCQAFVEQATLGHSGVYPSAIDAWQAQQKHAKAGFEGVKPGDAVYFTPNESNQGAGHTGIYLGDNKFISATDNGVMPYDLNDWYKQTGQHMMGYIPKEKLKETN